MIKEYDRDSMSWDGSPETLKVGMMVRVVDHLERLMESYDVVESMLPYAGKVSEVLFIEHVDIIDEGWDSSPYITLAVDKAMWTWRMNFIEPVNESIKREVKKELDKATPL